MFTLGDDLTKKNLRQKICKIVVKCEQYEFYLSFKSVNMKNTVTVLKNLSI